MKEIRICTTSEKEGKLWEESVQPCGRTEDCMRVINVYPEAAYQSFHGFGGALTEAAARTYAGFDRETKARFLEACYGETGLRYNLGRIHMNSCDFALGNYTCIEEGDGALETFSIDHDRKEILPMIRDACRAAQGRGGVRFLLSPWSPPAFMKTNGEMNNGGSLKEEYYGAWADYFVKFIREYEKEGVRISWLTVQNEPMAVQTWDSCIYTPGQESRFVGDFLGPRLEEAGLSDIGILVWDHNKEEAYRRFQEVLSAGNAARYVAGEAVHWYTGDHFEAIELVKRIWPDKEVFFTEGCVEFSRFADSGEAQRAEMYAHDILGNLNAGVSASIDWNVLLDAGGGPNHAGNFCAAPIMADALGRDFELRLPYYYIGQFSRFIRQGAVRIAATRYTDAIEAAAFRNPDGERVVVLLNRTDEARDYTLRENGRGCGGRIEGHSIQTLRYMET